MSLRYRDSSGNETIVSGLTPGGDIEAGAVATRTGTFECPALSPNSISSVIQVNFDSALPDNDYIIELTTGQTLNTFNCYYKTANGFKVLVANNSNTISQGSFDVTYTATKTYTVQHAAQNAEDIANILSVIPSDATSANKLTTQSDLENVEIDVDDALSASSTNPVQNKIVKAAIDTKQDKVFIGTTAEWEALSLSEKNKYELVNITDDSETGETVDAVTNGDMRAVTSNAVFDSLSFGRRITASSVTIQGDGTTWTPICDYSEFTGNYIGILFGFSTARTPIDFPKIMFNTNSNRTSRFPIDINDQCIGRLALRVNDNGELEASFYNKGTATSGFVVWAYTHN